MSFDEMEIEGSLSFDAEELAEIETANLMPAGDRTVKFSEVDISPMSGKLGGMDYEEGDGIVQVIINFQADKEFDKDGQSKGGSEWLRFLSKKFDKAGMPDDKRRNLDIMHGIALRTIFNIVKISGVEVPFDEGTGKQDFMVALKNLKGARAKVMCEHHKTDAGKPVTRFKKWRKFIEPDDFD